MRHALLVAALAVLVYVPSLGGGFVYDDDAIVAKDPRVQTGDLRGALTGPYWLDRPGGLYRPVTTASLVVQGFFSKGPFGYRFVNLVLHAGASVLVLALTRRLAGSARAAFVAGALFAVHPIHAEVAANVVGRSESLGFLLAGTAWLLVVPGASKKRLLLASLLAASGVLAKENALAVALGAALEALVFKRGSAARAAVPAIVAAAIALLLRRLALGGAMTPEEPPAVLNPLFAEPLSVRVMNAPYILLVYFQHLVAPFSLAPDYGGSVLHVARAFEPRVVLWWIGALGLLGTPPFISGRRGFFASGFFLLALLPVLQIVPIGTILGDRLAYAASFGFALAFAQARPPRTLAALLLGGFFSIAVHDAQKWRDTIELFKTAEVRVPESVQVHYVLGQLLAESEDPQVRNDAREELEMAARLAPGYSRPLLHLGFLESKEGRVEEASRHLEAALRMGCPDPDKARVEFSCVLANLGRQRLARNDKKGARAALERSLELDPSSGRTPEIQALLETMKRD